MSTQPCVNGKRTEPRAGRVSAPSAWAVERATGSGSEGTGIRLKNVVWARPMTVGDNPADVHVGLFPEENGEITFEIYSESEDDGPVVFSRGGADLINVTDIPKLDIRSLQAECGQGILESARCYEILTAQGIEYGPAHQGIETVHVGAGLALARLRLPPSVSGTLNDHILHPSLADAALQASVGLMPDSDGIGNDDAGPALPFALESLEIYGKCTSSMWALIREGNDGKAGAGIRKLDIDLCDEDGNVRARMSGFSSRVLEGDIHAGKASPPIGTLLLRPHWREMPVEEGTEAASHSGHVVILCEFDPSVGAEIGSRIPGVHCRNLKSKNQGVAERFTLYAEQIFAEIHRIIKDKPEADVLVQVVVPTDGEGNLLSGLAGLLRTARLESPRIVGQLIGMSADTHADRIAKRLDENARRPADAEIQYRDGRRHLPDWREIGVSSEEQPAIPWKDGGVYLITGGAGGLGLIFAEDIAVQAGNTTLILTGRSPVDDTKKTRIEALRASGAKVEYRQADVTQKDAVIELLNSIPEDFGSLDGIIHGAGVIRDSFILKKTTEEFREVLAPKVTGLVNLDEAAGDLPLDFFILFSSGSGPMGNVGQADYACANAFMDAYAGHRNELMGAGRRQGRTLSVDWPLWKDGGMRVDAASERMMAQSTGMVPMETQAGIRAMHRCLASAGHQVMVAEGNVTRMRHKLFPPENEAAVQTREVAFLSPSDTQGVEDQVRSLLIRTVSGVLGISPGDVDNDVEWGEFGFDSISLTELANMLNEKLRLDLMPTIFFEHPTIDNFSRHLTDSHGEMLASRFARQVAARPPESETPDKPTLVKGRSRFARSPMASISVQKANPSEPIAIVGMSCKFPMAEGMDEFWKNLVKGKNCITEIPENRWDKNKTKIKWGGFIDGIGDFDPMFFGISPREAELMDPQQRLLMLYVSKAMEDAGITPKALSQKPTGVFVSPGVNEYMNIVSFPQNDPLAATGSVLSAIPNRISYAFNLNGPSEYCETACSSSLVALHRAIASIRAGECGQAVIGAVNLLLSPAGFISSESMGYLSRKGEAKSFQTDADGFVRSEGVGAIIVKPLQKAIDDNDLIYAVIRGTGVSHGGRGMSLIAPTGRGMKAAMVQAYHTSGVSPQTVSYVEAHGTATPMGDAIEIDALKSGYDEMAASYSHGNSHTHSLQKESPCYISSLKPCIGHTETASGMAALIKAVMALNNKIIPGLPGFKNLNENISLKGGRFEITAENHEWEALTDADGKELPRRAAINSYGFGGVNAHAIIEEWDRSPSIGQQDSVSKIQEMSLNEPQIFALSAKNEKRLKAYVIKMEKFLDSQNRQFNIADVAYTLQIGREAMGYRLAMVVNNKEELIGGLKAYLQFSQEEGEGYLVASIPMFTGNKEKDYPAIRNLLSGSIGDSVLQMLLKEKNPEKMADYWVKGFDVPWESLYKGKSVRRISLPTYPFEKRRCWLESSDKSQNIHPTEEPSDETGEEICGKLGEKEDVRDWLKRTICSLLKLSEKEIRSDQEMSEFGFDSLVLIRLVTQVKDICNIKFPPEILMQYNTIEKLAQYLTEEMKIGFDDAEQLQATDIFSERKQQLRNFFKVIEEVNNQARTQSKEQTETRKTGFQSALRQASVNADMFRRAYESEAKVCYIGNLMCPEIPFAMDMIPFNIEIISSLFATNNVAARFLDIGEQNHLSRDICSAVRCMEGAAIENCLPTPNFIAHTSYYCDSATKMTYRLKEKYQSGYFMLDIPYNDDPDSVLYLSNQIRDMIAAMEEALKTELDPERLKQAVNYSKEGLNYLLKTTALYQNSFAPVSFLKSMNYSISFMSLSGSEDMLEIAKLNYEEAMKESSSEKDAPKTRPRVIWRGLTPFYSDEIIRHLEERCDFDLIPEFNLPYGDLQLLIDIDDPYLFLAQKLIDFSELSPVDLIIKNKRLNILEEYSIDGAIIFNQWGCRALFSTNQIIRDALSEKNIPVLEIDGDCIDDRNYSFSQVKVRLDAFAEILHSRVI